MAAKRPLTAERLREVLDYNPATGVFKWRGTRSGRRFDPGNKNGGYIRVMIDGHKLAAHRLAWLYVHGEWPPETIDHIDGNGMNNAISNLRLATYSENNRNRGVHARSRSGLKGVSYDPNRKRWVAALCANGKRMSLGRHRCLGAALKAHAKAVREHHGEFGRAK